MARLFVQEGNLPVSVRRGKTFLLSSSAAPPPPPSCIKGIATDSFRGGGMDVGAFLRFATLAKCPVSLWALLWNREREGEEGELKFITGS